LSISYPQHSIMSIISIYQVQNLFKLKNIPNRDIVVNYLNKS